MADSNDKMVDLKRSKESKSESNKLHSPAGDDYPYGTRLDLEDDHIDKLFGKDMPEGKTPVELHVKGHVDSSGTDSRDGKTKRRMSIQVTHMRNISDRANNAGNDQKQGIKGALKQAVASQADATDEDD